VRADVNKCPSQYRRTKQSMNISAPFIRKPIATSLLTVALLLAGGLAFFRLPVAPLPQVEYPVVSVSASLPGASPETMASAVATPLERQFGRIAGVNEMTSSSSMGNTNVTLQFDLNRDIDAAARDVQAAINAARSQLPANLPSNPHYRKINPADAPIMILALTSDSVPLPRIYDAADSILSQKLSQIEGVGQASPSGGARPAVRVEANPTALTAYGVGLDQVATTLSAANANKPKGMFHDANSAWAIYDTDQLKQADQYKSLIVAYNNGSPVRLSDVSDVEDSVEDVRNAGRSNGKPAVLIIVFRQPGANIIATVDRVIAELPQLRASIPQAIKLDVVLDRTTTVRASVTDIEHTMMISILLVIIVVFLFLRNLSVTMIPGLVVPLSLIGTFGVMYLVNYSLDNLSLMALTVSTGFVVDDAIVVIENITRHVEEGLSPFKAAMKGSSEIGFTVLSMSTSLVAVFIPILLMGGIVGRMFREFAVTLSVAIGISMLVSLSATPMMCAVFLRPPDKQKHGRMYRLSERFFNDLLEMYRDSLRWVLRHQPIMLVVTLLTIGLSVYLYTIVPKGFFPQQDNGRLGGSIQGNQDSSFATMRKKMDEFAGIVKEDPAVENVVAFNGSGNSGRMFVTLKPLKERKLSADQVINRLRPKLSHIPGSTLYLQATQDLHIGGRQSNSQYQFTLQDENLDELNKWSALALQKLKTIPMLHDVNMDQQNKGLETRLVIDRDTAARLGINPANVDSALYSAFGQRQVSTIYQPLNQFHVVMEVDPHFQGHPDDLRQIYVRSSSGSQVPLSAFSHYETGNTPLSVSHQGVFPAVTMSFNLAPDVSLSQASAAVNKAMQEIGLPSAVSAKFQGTAAAYQDSLKSQPWLIASAIFTVFIVLGVLYESYIHPVTILSTLPSAGIGALLALLLFNTELSVMAFIGIILLIGIVKKNAIMMVDVAIEGERNEGKEPEQAIFDACMLRFRPIMMTTMAALLGALPLALGTNVGSELRRPMGIAIVGGLIFSQMLTLYTTPVIYLYMDRLQIRIKGHKEKPIEGLSGEHISGHPAHPAQA
jgi:multidrug efflux pump